MEESNEAFIVIFKMSVPQIDNGRTASRLDYDRLDSIDIASTPIISGCHKSLEVVLTKQIWEMH